ncbi:MAG TPA: hypothetical protein VGO88_04725 [Mycetocola sp.]|jgi:hypothetical protein|nr:hypothetical protein [Mycetocola sp.]
MNAYISIDPLLAQGISRSMMTLYERDAGVVCYEVALLGNRDATHVAEFVTGLLASDLDWIWESAPAHPPTNGHDGLELSRERPATMLNDVTASALATDMVEVDEDNYLRFMGLFATARGQGSPELLEPRTGAIEEFCHERGPIQLAIIQIGDSPTEHVFVPHHLHPAVRGLLEGWGVHPASVHKRRPYRRLRMASLESLYPAPRG